MSNKVGTHKRFFLATIEYIIRYRAEYIDDNFIEDAANRVSLELGGLCCLNRGDNFKHRDLN